MAELMDRGCGEKSERGGAGQRGRQRGSMGRHEKKQDRQQRSPSSVLYLVLAVRSVLLLLLLAALWLVLLDELSDEVYSRLYALCAAGECDDSLIGRVGLRVADGDVGAGLSAQVADH